MPTPAELDPQHETLYRRHCNDPSLNHADLLKLLQPDAFKQEDLSIPVTPEGQEQGLQSQIQYDTIKALDFLASTMYRRAMPSLSPTSKLPAIFSHKAIRETVWDRQAAIYDDNRLQGPLWVLTHKMGTPRIQNPRLEVVDPQEYLSILAKDNSWVVRSIAAIVFKAEVRRGGHPFFTAVVECPLYITEPSDKVLTKGPQSGFVRVNRQYKRTQDTKRRLESQRLPVRTPKER